MSHRLDRTGPQPDLEWVGAEPPGADERSGGDPPDGLVTLRFLWNAVRRQARLWIAIAFVGLAAGALVPIALPAPSLASTRILLTHKDGDDPMEAMETDASLVRTNTVAQRVIDKLGLKKTPDELLEHYSTSSPTDRMLEISASAPTDAQAIRLASTVADTFLDFRMEQIRERENPINKDLKQAKKRVKKLHAKVAEDELINGTDDPEDSEPAAKLDQAETKKTTLQQTLEDMRIDVSLMGTSRVLDPAAIVPHSLLKALAIDAFTGLVGGLVVGVGLVVVTAVLSDRPRTRRDIARALGARVTLSLAGQDGGRRRPLSRLLFGRSRLSDQDLRVAAHHLYTRLPWAEAKPTLAVVGIDSTEATASIASSLAASVVDNGYRTLLVDLTGVLAKRLGVAEPGTQDASVGADGRTVVLHRPEAYGSAPEGPLLDWEGDDTLLAEWDDADLVLILADLPPALGGDHLRTWALHAAAVVTTGRTSATKIHSVAEMIGLAGLELEPVIVLGADDADETIGLPPEPATSTYSESLEMAGR